MPKVGSIVPTIEDLADIPVSAKSYQTRHKPLNIRVLDPQDGSLLSSEGFCAAMRVRLERRKDGVPVIFPTPPPSSDETGKAVITEHTISKGRVSSAKARGTGANGRGKGKDKEKGKAATATKGKGKGKAATASGGSEWSGRDGTDDPYAFLTITMMDVLEAGWSDVTKALDDPFLTSSQNTELHRRLPWVVIEQMVAVYDQFFINVEVFNNEQFLSTMANHVRAKSQFLIDVDNVLDLTETRAQCIRDIKEEFDPTPELLQHYLDQPYNDPDAMKEPTPRKVRPQLDVYPDQFDTFGPSWPIHEDDQRAALQAAADDEESSDDDDFYDSMGNNGLGEYSDDGDSSSGIFDGEGSGRDAHGSSSRNAGGGSYSGKGTSANKAEHGSLRGSVTGPVGPAGPAGLAGGPASAASRLFSENEDELLRSLEHSYGEGKPARIGSAPDLRNIDTLWELGVDTRKAALGKVGKVAAELERHRAPGYQITGERLINESAKGPQVAYDTDFINAKSSDGVGRQQGPKLDLVDKVVLPTGVPRPPPAPEAYELLPGAAAAAAAHRLIKNAEAMTPKTQGTAVPADITHYMATGERNPAADLSLVSAKTVAWLENAAADPEDEDEVEVHPLLLASSSSGRSAAALRASREAAAAETKAKILELKEPRVRKMYLMTNRSSPAAAAVDAYFMKTARNRIQTGMEARGVDEADKDIYTIVQEAQFQTKAPAKVAARNEEPLDGSIILSKDSALKCANVRVSDRIPKGTLALHSVAPLYREFDQQVDPKALEQMDVGLYRHAEVKLMYRQMLEQLQINHFKLEIRGMEKVLPRTVHDKKCLDNAFFSSRAVVGCYSAPGGRPVKNPALECMPFMIITKAEQYHLDMESSGGRSYTTRPPKVVANPSQSKEEARKAYAFNTWQNWWRHTFTTEDYMEYISEKKTDFLSTVFNCHGTDWELVDSEEEADNIDPEIAARHAKLKERMGRQRRAKSAFSKGTWNVNTVSLGGLAWNPAMADDDEDEDSENGPSTSAPSHAVLNMQGQLDEVWASLKMPANQKLDMVIKYNSKVFLEELESTWIDSQKSRRRANRSTAGPKGKLRIMADLTAMGDALDEAVIRWVAAAKSIIEREAIMRKLEVFERHASDPARHFRKHRDPGARDDEGNAITRVSEAKIRAKYSKQLAVVEEALVIELEAVYNSYGDIVTFEGKPYRHKMAHDRQEMLYWLEQERRHTNIAKNAAFVLPPLVAPASVAAAAVTVFDAPIELGTQAGGAR